jgi:hypothetical protein
MKLTKQKLMEIIKRDLRRVLEEGLELSSKEKAEAKKLLGLSGFSLEERVKMVLKMGAGETYNKITGALLGGMFGEKGIATGTEIVQSFPDIVPVEGDWAQDSGEEQAEFETGSFLTQSEWESIQNLVDILGKGGDKLDVANSIERAARVKRDPRSYIIQLRDLFGRLREFGSVKDETKGVSIARGGAASAEKQGYITLPSGTKFPTKKGSSWHHRFAGTRKYGYDLADALKYVNIDQLREGNMKLSKQKLKQIIKEELSNYLSNIYKWCATGSKCAPEKKKTTWWKGN